MGISTRTGWRLRAGLLLALLAWPAGAWTRESGDLLKVDVTPQPGPQNVNSVVPLAVTLRDAHNASAAAPANLNVTVEITGPSGQTQKRDVEIKAGQTSAVLDWTPSEAGVTKLKVREVQDRLLDGADAVLVKPAALPNAAVRVPAAPAASAKAKAKSRGKSKRGRAVPTGVRDIPHRWSVALTDTTRGAVTPEPPAPPPAVRDGYIDMQVSARDIGGVFADGNEAAKIDVFYVTPDGSDAPTDVKIWFHWEGGEVSPQPLIIKKGQSAAEAHWTSRAVLEGSLAIEGVSPQHDLKNGASVVKVRFVQPVQSFKLDVPPTLRLIEIGKLSAHFEDVNGNFINPGFTQFSFTPGSALVAVDPADPKLEPGAVEVHSDVLPKAFSGLATIRAAALGFAPQTKTVRITWLGVFALCVVGGALGGLLRYFASRGTLWKRLTVGLVIGTLGVLGYVDGLLGTKSLPLLHNLVAVPVTALLAGWLGLSLLDKIDVLAAFTGKNPGKNPG